MHGVQTSSAADITIELYIHWIVHRIVQDQLDYVEVCAHSVPKNAADDDKAHCMGLSCIIGHVTLIIESSFWR
jgi:hypothetical protein